MAALLSGWTGPAARPVHAEIIDRVLAVAAGELIMLSDVTAARDLGLVPVRGDAAPERQILTQLIDRALMLAEVDRYAPPEPDAASVDRELQNVRMRFASPEAFERALARSGINEQHLRGTLREDLRIRSYLEQRFTVAAPTENDLAAYYRDHPDEFVRAGVLQPLEQVRAAAAAAVAASRRRGLVDEWVAGLRRRAEIIDLSGR
jgi:hypothetical protein